MGVTGWCLTFLATLKKLFGNSFARSYRSRWVDTDTGTRVSILSRFDVRIRTTTTTTTLRCGNLQTSCWGEYRELSPLRRKMRIFGGIFLVRAHTHTHSRRSQCSAQFRLHATAMTLSH
uniref:Putative secreted protein n=1 Tax=Anopheles triannulatus TaxID=58253 RepID=A0A2M4B688_9DIPT